MKILAIDASGTVASAAIVNEDKVIAEYTVNYKITHSQTLMPMTESILKITETQLKDIDYIACACGPGSFTGLRIGAASVKGLALGLDKKIIPIPTLDAIAYNLYPTSSLIVPIMDARRNQVYTSIYSCTKGFERLCDHIACDIDDIISQALSLSDDIIFLGDGVPVYKEKLMIPGISLAPVHSNMQRAAVLGALALQNTDKAIEGKDLELMYLRKSQAEREREEKEGKSLSI